ncbi:DNA polymerase theta, putative [Entamoeba dispar SAW760]|uniref:DNA polymerase theta, putative n=1 Tax=Entamoeba dispar (strain ATCC PRA-260 / SAW760) TaxID=370354 RepID=B0ESC3_ENTDS|nr:DNA polymerase theta, putative [Entamoeba dispar SAW760]EDR22547.1 DNA polymerase theta, putative [Entamoeba dispar SAW760]|eukprot:EDR22547.1 DNA polymerase theta, putative [Entamoeba dispar SAW760]
MEKRKEEIITRYKREYETVFIKKPKTVMTKSERRKEKRGEEGERLLIGRERKGKIEERRRRGIERYVKIESVRKAYEKRGIKELFEWQEECLKEKGVREGEENLVYSAPTSSGKTLVSEILMIERYCQTQKKMIYIVPYVSMAQEKEEYFKEILESIKINIKGYFQNRKIDKEFDIGIFTIEKGNGIINKMIEEKSIEEVSIIIIDEIHMVFDKKKRTK